MQLFEIPKNMNYLFEDADYLLTEEDFNLLTQKRNRAENLEENNGAFYPGLTKAAAFWLNRAYLNDIPVNKKSFDDTIKRLSQIKKPSKY